MSNIANNRLNATMTTTQINAVKAAIQTIATNMPFLIGLSVEEHIALPKINIANKAFTEDTINALVNNNSMIPSYINVAAMQTDYTLFTQLDELLGLLRQIVEKAEDTQMLAGSEAYITDLTGYKLFAAFAESGIAGADAEYDSVKSRFINNVSTNPTLIPAGGAF